MSITVSREVIIGELKGTQEILRKWQKKLEKGVAGVDYAPQGDEESDDPEKLASELAGELLVVAGRCETLSGIVSGND